MWLKAPKGEYPHTMHLIWPLCCDNICGMLVTDVSLEVIEGEDSWRVKQQQFELMGNAMQGTSSMSAVQYMQACLPQLFQKHVE